jgi:pimeloyl-ACP methyl ester carboxylesterase
MGRVDAGGSASSMRSSGRGGRSSSRTAGPTPALSGAHWRDQEPALAAAGFQVVVPDLRGYRRSEKPEAVEAYALPVVAGDVLAILADLNIARAHLVGHDWGAARAWQLAVLAPGSLDHLAVLSVGHPVTFRRTLQQREKAWFMLLFQFPGIAERWLTEDNWAHGRAVLSRASDVRPVFAGALTGRPPGRLGVGRRAQAALAPSR